MYDFWKKHDFLLLSFCTQGFRPELQNPIVFKPCQSFSPRKKEFAGWMRVLECRVVTPSPTVCDGPPYLEGIGLFFRWWILRLRPVAARRMTALPEVSKFHNGMKGILSPLLVEQVLLTWLNLLVSSTMTEVGCMLSHISRHHVCRVTELAQLRSIYSQNDHPFTDTWESDPIDFSMSFCTKGIHARSCRIHHWCEWIIQLHPSGHSI